MSLTEVTIVIPTFNRPREFRRFLSFLDKFERVFEILVLDGSTEEYKPTIRAIAARYANTAYISYDPELHLGLRRADGLARVRTEFYVQCGDDDFVFPLAIRQCVEFLKANSDYAAAIGWVKTMQYVRQGWLRKGFTLGTDLEHGRDINHDQFCHRMMEYMAYTRLGFIPLYYSVRRARDLGKSLVRATMKYSSEELLNVLLVLLQGKLRILPVVSGIRDYSSQTWRPPERDDPVTYFTAADVDYIRGIMMDKLVREHGFDEKIAIYTLDLLLIRAEHRLDRVPDTPFKATVTALLNNLQRLGSILRPDLTADYLGIDHVTYRALRQAHADLDEALPRPS